MANKRRIRRRGQGKANRPTARATDMDRMLGTVAREIRIRVGLSQEKLARMVRVTFQQIQKYEQGTNRISGGMLHRMAGAFKTHPGKLFEEAAARLGQRYEV